MNYNERLSEAIEKSGILKGCYLEREKKNTAKKCNDEKFNWNRSLKELINNSQYNFRFLYTETEEYFAKVDLNKETKIFKIGSKNFNVLIKKICYEKFSKLPPKDFTKEFSELLIFEIANKFTSAEKTYIYTRIGRYESSIYYDLGNEKGEVIQINKDGYKLIVDTPFIFNKFSHQLSQIIPQTESNVNDIWKIFDYIRISERFKILFLVYLISCYIPDIPHPINVVFGTQGSSKTTANKLIQNLIDPSKLENLSLPSNTEKFIETIAPHWWISFDNISNISNTLSDELCKCVTGGSSSKRKLYTDDDKVIYTYCNCISLNGINCVVNRPDLMDRSLLFELIPLQPTERKTMNEILNNWEKDKPYILGAIFKILSKTIKLYESGIMLKELSRLADFQKWGYCIGEVIGNQGNKFCEELKENRQIQNIEIINSSDIATTLIKYLEERFNNYEESEEFEESSSDFYEKMKERTSNLRSFPLNPANFVKNLKRLFPPLKEIGIEMEIRHTNLKNILKFKINKTAFTSFMPSPKNNKLEMIDEYDGDLPL